MTKRMQNSYPSMQGFTLIEVLIAVLVLSIGLLGLASLQAASLKNNYGAYMRSQASILANDMADRIRSNPGSGVAGTGGALDGDYNAIGPGGLPTAWPVGCQAGACTTTQVATFDTAAWGTLLNNALPGGTGSVVGNGVNFTVTVMWDDERRGINGFGCSGNLSVDLACFTVIFTL